MGSRNPNYNPPSSSFPRSTLRSIRDDGNVLHDRINAQGFKECQNDILAVSGIVDDIRDALLDYQVSDNKTHLTAAT